MEIVPGQTPSMLYSSSSPTKLWMARAFGFGVGVIAFRAFCRSDEFQGLVERFNEWKNGPKNDDLLQDGKEPDDVHFLLDKELFPVGILDMDPLDRKLAWKMLKKSDIQKLHLICGKFGSTFCEETFDLHIDLDCHNSPQLTWAKNKSVQSCTVRHLNSIYQWDFLRRPEALRELHLAQQFVLHAYDIQDILRYYTNLCKLEVHIGSHPVCLLPHNNVPARILEILDRLSVVSLLNVRSMHLINVTRWYIEFEPNYSEPMFAYVQERELGKPVDYMGPKPEVVQLQVGNYVGYDDIMGEDYFEDGIYWKICLENQNRLTILSVDIGPTLFEDFVKVIRANEKTLEKIEIWSIVFNTEKTEQPPVDWNLYKNCSNLTHLSLMYSTEIGIPLVGYKPFRFGTMKLMTFGADLGLTHWKTFESIVNASAETLVKICLRNIDTVLDSNGKQIPFDFSMFRYCKNLTSLELCAHEFTFLKHKNFDTLPLSISNLDIYWFTVHKQHLEFIAKKLLKFDPFQSFMQTCSLTGLQADQLCAANFIYGLREKENGLINKIRHIANMVPILDTAATLYVIFV